MVHPMASIHANPVNVYTRPGNGRRYTDRVPPRPELSPAVLASARILGQDPKKRRKKLDTSGIGTAIEQAWKGQAATMKRYYLVEGNGQIGKTDTDLTDPPIVRITDVLGRPVIGKDVVFTVVSRGTIDQQQSRTVPTNQNGEAAAGVWRLGQATGSYVIEATVDNKLVATFQAVAY